jgi:cyanate lyase
LRDSRILPWKKCFNEGGAYSADPGRRNIMYKTEILERKRLEKGLSYTEIAEKLGIHKVTVARTLKGVTMKPKTVKQLADYLSVEMETIVQ